MINFGRRCQSIIIFSVFIGISWCSVLDAAEFCVRTATDLQSALTAAQANGQDDTVKIVQGTYFGNFSYESTEGRHISIQGGYTTGCADRVLNPSNTILDGNNAGIVLFIENLLNGGNIFIEGITAQHGNCSDVFHSGGINAVSESYSLARGDITVKECIITENTGIWYGGVVAEFLALSFPAAEGDVALIRNTIVDNVGLRENAGAYAHSQGGNVSCINNIIARNIVSDGQTAGLYAFSTWSQAILTNNTIVLNAASSNVGGIELTKGSDIAKVYNNIVWGNTPNDIYLAFSFSGTAEGYNNNYSLMDGEEWALSAGNIDADPFFEGARDFHLKKGSPCIDKGSNIANALPAVDLEGNSRMRDGNGDRIAVVDMGAYEYIMPVTPKEFKNRLPWLPLLLDD